ncbi:MAG TPA: SpoIIE family protein phosphatase [Firmicutes bacterium]|nr:SpoIIE family protein phosphatase [Bacillota bacterium]
MDKQRYHQLLGKLIGAVVHYRILMGRNGRPRGLIFLDSNPAFARMAGLNRGTLTHGSIMTETPAELIPFGFDWLGIHALLDKSNGPLRFEHYSKTFNRHYEVMACRDEEGYFAVLFRDIPPSKKKESRQNKTFHLLTALLEGIPGCLAMILEKYSRIIVAANQTAQKLGAIPGATCFEIAGRRKDSCPFCLAPKLWASGQAQYLKTKYLGRWYEGIWTPLTDDLYVHFILDINDYKLAEKKNLEYSRKVERLYCHLENEMEKINKIHRRTFPIEIPRIRGCTLAAHYQPAKRLGGDFYDIIRTGHRLLLYLSDVSGHGPEGVLLSAFTKEAINSYVSLKPDEIDPEKLLLHLYKRYCQQNYPEDYFISIFLAIYDCHTRELFYLGAGTHTPPLIQLGNGKRPRLAGGGLPVSNTVPATLMNLSSRKIVLAPGSTILFHTDGLVEQEVNGVCYGKRLAGVFSQSCHLPPEAIVGVINRDFMDFNNGNLQGDDDITFIVLQTDPP